MKRNSSKKRWFPGPVFVLLGIACAYADGLQGPFIFDDGEAIEHNRALLDLGPAKTLLLGPKETTVAGRPVVNVSLALNYLIGGLDPIGYHLVNVLLHALCALTLLGIARRTFLTPPLAARFGEHAAPLAAAIATLWAVHPLATEAVTYIIERTELLMGLFFLLTLFCAIRAWEQPQRWWPAASTVCCALGMASKETMVSAPLIVMLYDRLFLYPSWAEAFRRRRKLYAALAITWIVLLLLAMTYPREKSAGFNLGMKWWEYAGTQCSVLLTYLRLAVWPRGLCLDYGTWVASWPRQVLPGLIVLSILVGATVWALVRGRPAGFLGAWFFLILAPTSSVLPIITEVAAERRMYLPLAAVVTLLVLAGWLVIQRIANRWVASSAERSRWKQRIGWRSTVGLALVLVVLTALRNQEYRSLVTIWTDTVAERPDNPRAQYNLAVALADSGLLEDAVRHYREAIRLKPDYADAFSNLGTVFAAQGDDRRAVECYRRALEIKPILSPAHNNLGQLLAAEGKFDAAIREYRRAIALDGHIAEYHRNLALALHAKHDLAAAAREYTTLIGLDPRDATAHNGLGVILQNEGQLAAAGEEYEAALQLDPKLGDAQFNIANYYAQTGKLEAAVRHYRIAIAINPGNRQAMINLQHVLSLLQQRTPRSGQQ
ncbi:MAG TPA: tetratricopeptide repeat protein [Pirellulales bacterium]|jgi:tetratricopeptide (TPR) repeat protein|nr:tetratricopeptide repeat protein [Pirellulales bacterium]